MIAFPLRARRSRLFAASLSVLALVAAGGAVAQEAPADQAPAAPEPHVVIAEPDKAPEEPAAPPIPAVWAPVPTDAEGASAYGLYLAGKLALMRGEGAVGADFLARANRLTPEQPRVREQAFTAALLTGDLDVAAALAPSDGSPAFVEAGRLVQTVQAFVHGDARAADAALNQPIGAPHARAGIMITPWIAAAAGDWTRALQPAPTMADPLTLAIARVSRASLLERRRDYAGAEAELKGLADAPTIGALFKRPYGEFLERRRRRPEAIALYQAGLTANPDDTGLKRALARAQAGERPPALPTFRAGAAQGLTTAAFQAANERGNEFAAVYLRLALNLEYDDTTQYTLAQMLSRAGLNSAARAALERIGPDDAAVYAAARAELASSYAQEGQDQAALTELRRAAAALPADPRIALMLAGQLVQLKDYDAALTLLNGPLLNTALQPSSARFLRGATYEAMNRIPEAEAELWAALQSAPNDANTLNYLGYLWVDKGLRVQQGADMIARAHALEPNNGHIEDSLGWAQYRQGQFDTAVTTLEQAVDKEPANAEINDHLGDAYWRVGRRREAGWLWNRVLTLDPDAERRAEVERKIAQGLDDAPASTGVSN
ncbi:tetratricopeptide repeat protein [Brevundimonas sp.]|uniref:tetratricopeptide repeat protein n=1 Tax=Brevundimonas sp. TaxID=1871086 RepID=UPI0025B97678|nr:tetratricopeptide repeat protein [Brevundimonas sp.]